MSECGATPCGPACSPWWGHSSIAAAGCGGDDEGSSTSIEGLGSSLEEIQEMAREEGQVNIVQWAGYAQLTKEFKEATGCTVNTKDGGSSDDMISLIQTGEYDGVSASGNASVRLMATGEVAADRSRAGSELRRCRRRGSRTRTTTRSTESRTASRTAAGRTT